jgi:hypothetical protein
VIRIDFERTLQAALRQGCFRSANLLSSVVPQNLIWREAAVEVYPCPCARLRAIDMRWCELAKAQPEGGSFARVVWQSPCTSESALLFSCQTLHAIDARVGTSQLYPSV